MFWVDGRYDEHANRKRELNINLVAAWPMFARIFFSHLKYPVHAELEMIIVKNKQ